MRHSLRIRLTIIFIGLAIGPLLLMGGYLTWASFNVEREQALDLQSQVAQRAASEIEAFLQDVENDLNLLNGEIRGLEQPDHAQQLSLLLGAFSSGPYRDAYEEFALLDSQGQEQLRVSRDKIIPADELGNRVGRAEYEQPKATRSAYFSPVWFDETTGKAFISIAIPFAEPRSVQLNGVLVANIRFKTVGDRISKLQVSAGQTIYVIDSEGQVVTHEDPSISLTNLRFDIPKSTNSQIGLSGNEVVLATDSIELGDQELTVVAERPEAEALAPAYATLATIALTTVATLAIAIGLGFLVVRQVVRPVERLAVAARAITDGDLSQRTEVTTRDELGDLANAFNSMATQLQEIIGRLEEHVADRTWRLEIVAALGEYLNSILDVDELLSEVVNQIKNNLGFYHTHIYLLDEDQEKLTVVAGTGSAGAEMKDRGHSISLGAASLVARAARSGDVVSVDNVREVADWLPNPLLPDTYSEMAIPVVLEGQIVGVLDVQQDKIAGFDESDVSLLRSLANQVAVAIRNARLFNEVRTNLAEARELQRRYTEQAWERKQIARRGVRRVQFSLGETSTLNETMINEARRHALAQSQPHLVTLANPDTSSNTIEERNGDVGDNLPQDADKSTDNGIERAIQRTLVAPIQFQGVTIGNLQLHQGRTEREWTKDELALITAVVDQVAQTAENLRLLDSIQERANREQLIGQISAKLRRAPNMESLLEIGASELASILRPARTFIRLGASSELAASEQPEDISEIGGVVEKNTVTDVSQADQMENR